MTKSISEILAEAASKNKKADRVAILQKNSSAALKKVLGFAYDPRVVFALPEGNILDEAINFANKADDLQGALYNRARMLDYVIQTPTNKSKPIERERIFFQLLESVDPDDARLLIAIKDKKLPEQYSKVSKEVVAEAFPGIAKGWEK